MVFNLYRQGRLRPHPSVPGHEFSGVLEAVPPNALELKIGDAVYAVTDFWREGAAGDYIEVGADSLAPKPAPLTHTQAAAVPLSALTAWQALFDHAAFSSGQRVLVQGAAGGVGSYAVQLAHDRPSELETEIGAIVRLARTLRMEVPRLAFLYASLLPQERQAGGEIQFTSPESETIRA